MVSGKVCTLPELLAGVRGEMELAYSADVVLRRTGARAPGGEVPLG